MKNSRGFTLVELAVSTAIASVVMMGIFALMTSQIEGHNRQERVTTAQMLVRSAMMESVSRISKAGFGLPPDYAFGPSGIINNATGPGGMDTCVGTDVIEIRSRDPRGTWMLGAGSSASTLNISGVVGLTGDPGWPNGTRVFVFAGIGKLSLVRTNANRAVNAGTVALRAAESASISLPGHATVSPDSQVWAVDTTRLRVVCTDADHPTLMLERDVDIDADNVIDIKDQEPIASDIEDLQVAYLIDRDQDGIVTEADAFNHPSLVSDPTITSEAMKYRLIKGIRLTLVGRAKSIVQSSNAQLTIEDHVPTAKADDKTYVRRPLRQIIMLDNRDTTEPNEYLHVSNEKI
jgi:prepilin-type N-terminal cleavage/methylation domain-containing protein